MANEPILVDSNVLLDLLTDDPAWGNWSYDAIANAMRTSRLVTNPIVYAEVSVRLATVEDVERAFPTEIFAREAIPYDAAFLAGKAFGLYRQRGGTRTSPLPDFFIGAHAAVAGYRLLTRDPSRFRSYFPILQLIVP